MAPRSHASVHAARDLLVRHEVRGPAQVLRELPLRERAEPATEVADVRVLDVPRDDVRHLVAAHLPPERVGRGEHPLALASPGREEADELRLAELLAGECERSGIAADDERHRARLARRPPVLPREPVRVGGTPDRRGDRGIGPPVEVGDVLGVERQARSELEPAARARGAEPLDVGPRRLGVDVVDRSPARRRPSRRSRRRAGAGSRRRRGSAAPGRGRRDRARSARPRPTRGAPPSSRRDAQPSACPASRGSSGRSPRAGGRTRPRASAGREARRFAPPVSRRSRRGRRS